MKQDQDRAIDIYDARVGGGIPAQNEVPPPGCLGEGCQGIPTATPGEPSVASGGLQGLRATPKRQALRPAPTGSRSRGEAGGRAAGRAAGQGPRQEAGWPSAAAA